MSSFKSRNRIAGRKIDAANFEQAMFEAILSRIRNGVVSPSEIGKELGKDRSTIFRYLQKMQAKGLVQLSDTGRIERTKDQAAQAEYKALSADEFVQSYPSVRKWVDDMAVRKDGKPIAKLGTYLGHLKRVCDVLKLSPEALTVSRETCEDAYRNFVLEFRKESQANPHGYKMALRNFAMFNNIHWARGVSGMMSGKKQSYGKYAHVKLSPEQIKRGVEIARAAGKEQLARWFRIGIETCARRGGLATIPTNSMESFPDFLTLRDFESKTQTTWTKYIIDPTAQEMVKAQVEDQSKLGKTTLFLNGVGEDAYYESMNLELKWLYKELGVTEPFFYLKPTHALRHCGAHYWLQLTNYDYNLVKKIGGWKTQEILEECYGARPPESVRAAILQAHQKALGGVV
jgi:predicted transcriptional regulator